MSSPTFSVVIATYERRAYALQAIASVKAQTHAPHEVIVVVDGSSDGTAEATRTAHPDVIVVEQDQLGASIAHNHGVAVATGDYVCFLDDDDLWHHDKLATTAKYLADNPECGALCNPVWFFSEPGGPQSSVGFGVHTDFHARTLDECHERAATALSRNHFDYLEVKGRSMDLMLDRARGFLTSSVVRRDVLLRAGLFPPSQSCGDDWTMFLNVSRLTEWHVLPEKLGFTRLHARQNSGASLNGLYILAGRVNAWHGGRPLRDKASWADAMRRLTDYRLNYRREAQAFLWDAVRRRDLAAARTIRWLAGSLLPRRRDRAYVLVPPPLAYAVEHRLLRRVDEELSLANAPGDGAPRPRGGR